MKLLVCVSLLLVLPVIHALPTENQQAENGQCELDFQVKSENEIKGVFEKAQSGIELTFHAIKEDNEINAQTTTSTTDDGDTITVYLSLPDSKSPFMSIEKEIIKYANELVENTNCQLPANLNTLHEELADKLYQCTEDLGMSQLRFSIMYLESVVTSAQRFCNGADSDSICTAYLAEGLFMCEEDLEELYSKLATKNPSEEEQGEKKERAKRGFNCPGMSGGDLGCCGNYAGPCYFCHAVCLAHDLACLDCAHWWCGPACQPGAVHPGIQTNNVIPSVQDKKTVSTNTFQ